MTNTPTWERTPLADRYHELQRLAAYFRWLASHGPEIGSRSPLTGRPYTSRRDPAVHKAYKAAAIAMSREYYKAAKEYRQDMTPTPNN